MRAPSLVLGAAFGLSSIGGSALADAAYCPDLKRLIDLAASKVRFAPIAGQPREGNFRDTTMPLAGWADCSLYGSRTYTCDSRAFETAGDAERALAARVDEIKLCLGEAWRTDESRSSPVYVVVRNEREAASMTLSTDRMDDGRHLVRLTVFVRGG